MCIFSQPVLLVNNTQIFARKSARGTQLLAYQMNYESRDQNAMILPVPVRQPAHDASLRFIDLSGYGALFDDLKDGFPSSPQSFSIGCSRRGAALGVADLKVFEVGNYVASYVPSLSAFSRLDARFTLPDDTWSQIPQYKSYGFAVFQLAAGELKPHPMAFEFETAMDSLYFPTLHIHDGEVHAREEFDHALYLQHAGFDSRVYGYENADVPDRSTGLIRSKHVARHFCNTAEAKGTVDPELLVHRRLLHGNHPNRDTVIETFGDPVSPALNFRPWLASLPWLVTAFVVTWFWIRRSKIRRLRTAGDRGSQRAVATEQRDESKSR